MPGFDFTFNFGVLSGLINSIANLIRTVFVFLFHLLVAIYNFLVTGLLIVARWLVTMFGHVRNFFVNLWNGVIKKGLLGLYHILQRFTRWLEPILDRINNFLDKVLEWYDRIYKRIVGPILQAISRIRKVLSIFRLFGIKWAQKLDAKFLRIEQKLIEPYLRLRAALVGIINVIDTVLDLGYLIRRPILLGSLARIADAILSIFGISLSGGLTAADALDAEARRKSGRDDKAKATIEGRAKSGLSDRDKREIAAARAALKTATGDNSLPLPAAE